MMTQVSGMYHLTELTHHHHFAWWDAPCVRCIHRHCSRWHSSRWDVNIWQRAAAQELVGVLCNRRYTEQSVGYVESHDQALVGDQTLGK